MNILYFTNLIPRPNHPTNGIFNYHRVKELLRKGHTVDIVTYNNIFDRRTGFSFKSSYNLNQIGFDLDQKIQVINGLIYPSKKICLNIDRRLNKIFSEKQSDLIHSHVVLDAYAPYLLSQKKRIPYIVTVHGSDIHTHPFNSKNIRNVTIKILANATHTIFVSEYLLHKARDLGYTKKNFSIIPNGVDQALFFNKERPCNNAPVIGFAGNLQYVKGADRLPKLFSEIKKLKPQTNFFIIGDGPLKFKIDRELNILGIKNKVNLISNVSQEKLASYFNQMDILVLPSRNEGFGCVALEAQACGTPVVGSSNGGLPEAIGKGGIVVNEGANFEKRFAKKVMELLSNPIPRFGLIERAKDYSWSEIVEQELSIYKKIPKNKYSYG